jgi:hypothetical protein
MRLLRFDELRKPIVLAVTIRAVAGFANAQFNNDDDEKSPTPPGLYITPTALANAVQQPLNPGLTNYPKFVAGQAVCLLINGALRFHPRSALFAANANSSYGSGRTTTPFQVGLTLQPYCSFWDGARSGARVLVVASFACPR